MGKFDISSTLRIDGVDDYFFNGPNGEVEDASSPRGHALGAALGAASAIARSICAQEFGSLLETYFLGEARTAIGFHLIVDAQNGEERYVGIVTRRDVDVEAVVASIQQAALS
jgi:hypothetical protein